MKLKVPQLRGVNQRHYTRLRKIYREFSTDDALRIKTIEKTTNHDVKAVEYFLKEKFDEMGLHQYKEFIHFGLTSQDINNTATPLSIKEAVTNVYLPELDALTGKLDPWRPNGRDTLLDMYSMPTCIPYPPGQGNKGVYIAP